MKYQTEDQNDIMWMRNPYDYPNIADEVRIIKEAGMWDVFLFQNADEDDVVDADALYEYLWHDGDEALRSVGLHRNQATATVEDVLKAWEEENETFKVSRDENGKPTGLWIADGTDKFLYFECVGEDGTVESVCLDDSETYELLENRILMANNATGGGWDSCDPETAVFEMWR